MVNPTRMPDTKNRFNKKKRLALAFAFGVACLLTSGFSLASTRPDSISLIRQAHREGRITADQAALYFTYKIFDPEKLPEEFRSDTLSREATMALFWIDKHRDEFSPETRQELSGYKAGAPGRSGMRAAYSRPELTSEKTYSTTHFMFHYTTTSGDEDEVDPTDTNPANGTPDYVDMMATEFENVWNAETGTLGYTRPPGDGDGLFDVYIGELVSYGWYGFAIPETLVGDNPYSQDYVETNAKTTYMIMDNDYSGVTGSPLTNIQSVAAHEFFHCIQSGYDASEERWLFEATATWVEDEVHDNLDNNYDHLPLWFASPDLGLSSGTDNNYYGSWIFMRYVSEHHGGASTIKRIWEISRTHDSDNGDYSFQTIGEALVEKGTTFDTAFGNFAVANHIMEPPGSGHPYTYEEASGYLAIYGAYPPVKIENTIDFTGSTESYSSSGGGNGRLNGPSADYLTLTGSSAFKVDFNGDDSAKFAVKLIQKSLGDSYTILGMTLNSSNDGVLDRLDPSAFAELVLVVINLGTDGSSVQYSLELNATDIDPPVQSNWSPAKGSALTTTTPTLTFSLDENGDCRWSLTDQAYSDMTGDCDGDGTTSQSCAISGLQEGADSAYIACKDTVGNEDTSSTNEEINYTIDLFSLEIKQGWNLIGISRTDASMQPGAALLEVIYFAKQGDYSSESSKETVTLNFAGGYWIFSNNATQAPISGIDCSGASCNKVTLYPGWSAFSIPYTNAVDWKDSSASISCNSAGVDLTKVYGYDTDSMVYVAVTPNSGAALAPWKGYWIHLDDSLQEPCELTFTQ